LDVTVIRETSVTNALCHLTNLLAYSMTRAIDISAMVLALTNLVALTSLRVFDMTFLAIRALFASMRELALACASLLNALVRTCWVTKTVRCANISVVVQQRRFGVKHSHGLEVQLEAPASW
jgi:hypothetical protein